MTITASHEIKWRQDYIELKYFRKKPRIFGPPMHTFEKKIQEGLKTVAGSELSLTSGCYHYSLP